MGESLCPEESFEAEEDADVQLAPTRTSFSVERYTTRLLKVQARQALPTIWEYWDDFFESWDQDRQLKVKCGFNGGSGGRKEPKKNQAHEG